MPDSEESTTLEQPATQVINFNVNDARIAEAAEEFKEVDASKDYKAAKGAKNVLTKMRTTLAEAHKKQKAKSLAYGRTLDAEKNRLLALIAAVEDPIKDSIKLIDDAEEKKEEERVEAIQERIQFIRDHGTDLDGLNLIDLYEYQEELAKIPLDSTFEEFLIDAEGAKAEAESHLRIAINKAEIRAKEDAEREEEEQRLEDQRKQQEALQVELDAARKKLDEQAEAQRLEQEESDRITREEQKKKDAERQAELDKQAEEQAAEQKKIDDENARIAQEAADKEAAEQKAQEEAEAEEKRLAAAPDIEKLEVYAQSIKGLVECKPNVTTDHGQSALEDVVHGLIHVHASLTAHIEEMK